MTPSPATPSSRPLLFQPIQAAMFADIARAYWRQWGTPSDEGDPSWRLWAADLVEKATLGFSAWRGGALLGLAVGHLVGAAKLPLPAGWVPASEWLRRTAEESPASLAFFLRIAAANVRLRSAAAAAGRTSEAELDFLWVAKEARGLGLSKTLLALFSAELRQAGAARFALFTDSGCDFSYYCRKPWERWSEWTWPDKEAEEAGIPGFQSFMFSRPL